MGLVYLAHDDKLDRRVALKVLPARFTSDAERVRRFQREARAASALNHPNILTIFDIGQENALHYIATEFVEGQTLRALMGSAELSLGKAIDVAMQIGSALAASHQAGIIHRDIKPENVMVRPDGYVKLLDFGLAKLTEQNSSPREGDTDATRSSVFETQAGIILGTAPYMSPEQARGQKVDARSDLFSLGVVLYELITGARPFTGATRNHLLVAILDAEPPPLAKYISDPLPPELHHIISRALAKEREHRYPAANELMADLKMVKEDLISAAHSQRVKADGERTRLMTAAVEAASTGASDLPSTTSRISRLGKFTQTKPGAAVAFALVVIAALAVSAFFYFNRRAPLTEKDTILLADFENKTGETVFDGTLKLTLAIQLEQSPYLNIYSDEQVRAALHYMNRSADERVTKTVAREICQRQGLKALLGGTLANLGSQYVIMLEAVNAQTGEVLARQQKEAGSKEQVLSSLGQAASELRAKLGESLRSIQKFDTPLAQATTSSLEALKAFSMGTEKAYRGKNFEAIPLFKLAAELDPNFALAHNALSVQYYNTGQPELAVKAAEKAFAMRERVTEREKLVIAEGYYTSATGELDKAIEVLKMRAQIYPQDFTAHNNLALSYYRIGQYEKALEESRATLRINPSLVYPHLNLAADLMGLNQFDEARATLEQMFQQKLDMYGSHFLLYLIASFQADTATLRQQLDWLERNANEYWALDLQAWTAAQTGQMRQAQSFSRRAVELAAQRHLKDLAASFAVKGMLNRASCGLCGQARQEAALALAHSRAGFAILTVPALPGAAFSLALCGETGEAQKLADELAGRYPKATLVNVIYLPVIRAAIELQRGHADRAVELLEVVTPYESAAAWWPNYLRGQAYLRLKQGDAAAVEFQKILDHRGWGLPTSIFYQLAHLGLARAAALSGEGAKARQAYQDFFAAWKDADTDLPVLIEAKREFNR